MGNTAILAIRIIGDANGAVDAFGRVDGAAATMQQRVDNASRTAGIALAGLTTLAAVAGNSASELQQSAGAVDSVFGQYARSIHNNAEDAADAVGLSQAAYSNMAAILGAQLKNMGMSLSAAGDQTESLIGLGSDLAATFGGTTSDAVAALSSLLRGERDPIERYGVSIKAADIAARLAAQGQSDLTGEALRAAETQATLALLLEQTADAQGQFSRESDTAAGQAQRASAEWENASAALGEQLLPLMAEGAQLLAGLAGWMSENTELVTVLAGAIGVISVGIIALNGALKLYAAVQAAATAATWASNAAWLASPITWIILAIAAAIAIVIAIGVLIVENWDAIAAAGEEVWGNLVEWFARVQLGFELAVMFISAWWNGLVEDWNRGIDSFIGWIQDAIAWIARLANDVMPDWLKDLLGIDGNISVTTTDVPSDPTLPPPAGGAGAGDGGGTVIDNRSTTNLTVQGAIDSDGTARKVREVLDSHDRKTGRTPSGGGTQWR
ncbi:hypothetical protein [Microbacterium dauci]|uniref:Tape measure protein n=1 Tax=Microbacterium dauci TaxID=3048008 RepID=A0ABT6ZGR3_9MICO|nr:hypothetical protein [Microbacterium sp. LX3-4]MDJ1115347.1 hypothetical protein [Microbacterium sp. LX3-4]